MKVLLLLRFFLALTIGVLALTIGVPPLTIVASAASISSARATGAPAILSEAQQSYTRADYTGAIAKLRGADDAASLLLMGQSYAMLGNFKQAVIVLERAITLKPGSSDAHLWLGRAYGHRAEGAFPTSALNYAMKARDNFEKAVALDPHNWDALDDLFQFYLQAPGFLGGGSDKASQLIEVIAQHDPGEGAADRGRVAEQKKDYETAETQYRLALKLEPQFPNRKADLNRLLAKRKAAGS